MIAYSHFALSNLYLINGYKEEETHHGIERVYEYEDELEQCVRRLVVRKPERLRGWDLRFLRRGLNLSQADFGQMVDRDAQTVARWEKSADAIPKFVDLTIRVRFAEHFEPGMSLQELLSYVDGLARKLPEKVLLKLEGASWSFNLEPRVKVAQNHAQADLVVNLPSGQGSQFRVYVASMKHKEMTVLTDPKAQFNEWTTAQLQLKNIGIPLRTLQGTTNDHTNSTRH